jgi:AraC family transcriptional regulator of adaptative response / DNA-3-methyladenine glycosylase II
MLDRFLAGDAAYDGRFLTGVLTTGIYCLPSCVARKPLSENVRFFPDERAARAAGLRPCLRCRPDAYYEGRDPDRERLEAAVRAMRADPARLAGIADLARAAFVGVRKLNDLVRHHYHTTPGALLAQARVFAAQKSLQSGARVIDAAYDAGFDSLSAFNEGSGRATGRGSAMEMASYCGCPAGTGSRRPFGSMAATRRARRSGSTVA